MARYSKEILDLLWVMRSPSLLSQSLSHGFSPSVSDEWCQSKLREAMRAGRIDVLARDSTPLLEHLAKRRSKTRLGIYFESLIEYWLRYLIAGIHDVRTEVQVHENKETIGAYDFLFYDERDARLKHWEVAIKYYLYVPSDGTSESRVPAVEGVRKSRASADLICDRERFYGPQTLDRLHLKLEKMLHHQIPLGRRVEAASEMLIKGILFYPFDRYADYVAPPEVAERHERGAWLHIGDFANRDWKHYEFFELERLDWMNAAKPSAPRTVDELKRAFERSDESVHLMMKERASSGRGLRLFLVKENWPDL